MGLMSDDSVQPMKAYEELVQTALTALSRALRS